MKRLASLALVLTLLSATALAQVDTATTSQGPVTSELDIPYADTGNPRHRLDLYLPKERDHEKLPVIVFIHGGGWMFGDKSDGAGRLMPLLRTGEYAGVSVEYRLSDEATWPAQIHDVKAAVRWIRANARKYALDPNRIGVWGRSAGAHLALMLGVTGDVAELDGRLGPYKGLSSKVTCVVNFFGATDLPAMIGKDSDIDRTSPDAFEAKLIGGALPQNPAKAKSASPITYVTPGDPPVLTVHGNADRTVPYDQAVRIDAALHKAGVPSYFVTVEGGGHDDFGSAADDRVTEFFAKCLQRRQVEVSTAPIVWRRR
jgi:acetyl esterase/lipase